MDSLSNSRSPSLGALENQLWSGMFARSLCPSALWRDSALGTESGISLFFSTAVRMFRQEVSSVCESQWSLHLGQARNPVGRQIAFWRIQGVRRVGCPGSKRYSRLDNSVWKHENRHSEYPFSSGWDRDAWGFSVLCHSSARARKTVGDLFPSLAAFVELRRLQPGGVLLIRTIWPWTQCDLSWDATALGPYLVSESKGNAVSSRTYRIFFGSRLLRPYSCALRVFCAGF